MEKENARQDRGNIPDDWTRPIVDPTAFAEEQRRLASVWTFLGMTSDAGKDGDWFRASIATRSVFVQRFGTELRGFENVCAHRFMPLRNADRGNGPVVCQLPSLDLRPAGTRGRHSALPRTLQRAPPGAWRASHADRARNLRPDDLRPLSASPRQRKPRGLSGERLCGAGRGIAGAKPAALSERPHRRKLAAWRPDQPWTTITHPPCTPAPSEGRDISGATRSATTASVCTAPTSTRQSRKGWRRLPRPAAMARIIPGATRSCSSCPMC